ARLLSPLLRLLERLARGGGASVRIALLSLARAPGEVLLTVVFFTLSVGIAVFAISYRATLVQGEHDQARYAVPPPVVLQEDLEKLVTIEQAPPPARDGVTPVLRDSGFVTAGGGRNFTLLALPAGSLHAVDGWRSDFSSRSPSELAALLRPAATPRLAGVALPRHARSLTLPVAIAGDKIGLTVIVANRRGDFTPLSFGEHGRGEHTPTLPLPPESRGGRIVAIRVSYPQIAAFVAGHRESGTTLSLSRASTGTLRLRREFAGCGGTNGISAHGRSFRYLVNRAADSFIRPAEPLEGLPVPVVASPAIANAAGPGGVVPLHVGDSIVPAQVVAIAKFFPSVDG